MLDTTSYTDKLPASLNDVLKSFSGNDCVMVRKAKDKLNGKSGNCHINVQNCIDKKGGTIVSGWLLNRDPKSNDLGMYVWSFHSVWQKADGKLLDVTEDKHYIGRDKSIFVPDAHRKPDLVKGTAFNNFTIFTNLALAVHYGNNVGKNISSNKIYWCDQSIKYLLSEEEHSGEYHLIHNYPNNYNKMCVEYNVDYIDGKFVKRDGTTNVTAKIFFDYNLKSK